MSTPWNTDEENGQTPLYLFSVGRMFLSGQEGFQKWNTPRVSSVTEQLHVMLRKYPWFVQFHPPPQFPGVLRSLWEQQ